MRLKYPKRDNLSSPSSRQRINEPLWEVELGIPETLGQRIARAKRKRSVSNRELAEVAGVHANTVSKWLSDVQKPDAEALDAVARRLEVSSSWLLHGGTAASYDAEEIAGMSSEDAARLGTEFQPLPGRAPRVAETAREEPGFTPNPALRKRLRPVPYARVYEHIERMVAARCTIDQIEEAERLMIDGAYNKLNARDPRERSDEDMILDIDDAWDWIKEVLSRSGVKL
ncbi:MAG TPA: helix-turn-helix transcriptional regulator [Gemmatimonadaceae bacterium]|nr:helix-turn-helix transcriptional regulator [Gemmatimonadaceae bacterium]